MEREKASLLTSFNGSVPLTGAVTIQENIEINAIAVGGTDVAITEIRIARQDKRTKVFKYKIDGESLDWDGKTLSAYDILTIPDRYVLHSISIDNQVQGVLLNSPEYEAV